MTIIIEGPVEVVNINIITIYDIDVRIDDDDPVLEQIDVGDFVRIEKEFRRRDRRHRRGGGGLRHRHRHRDRQRERDHLAG
ncbi:MAG: hypothetical protein IPK19_26625 [Chloroflexi bacterium]|nr:hypothetical protein [Chloroflexota bacterium]